MHEDACNGMVQLYIISGTRIHRSEHRSQQGHIDQTLTTSSRHLVIDKVPHRLYPTGFLPCRIIAFQQLTPSSLLHQSSRSSVLNVLNTACHGRDLGSLSSWLVFPFCELMVSVRL
jgi:hypothetical protein